MLSSCSNWFHEIKFSDTKKQYSLNKRIAPNSCQNDYNQKRVLAGVSDVSHELYRNMLKSIQTSDIKLKPIDELTLWILLQINLRPDQASIYSRLQLLINQDKKEYYFDFFDHKNTSTPSTLMGLKRILSFFGSNYTLYQLSLFYRDHLLSQLQVDTELSSFLYKHKEELAQNPVTKRFFFRGEQLLRNSERIAKINFARIIKKTNKSNYKNLRVIKKLYPLLYRKNQYLSCNFDVNLYQNKFVFIRKNKVQSHLVAYSKNRFSSMVALTLSKPKLTTDLGYPLYKSTEDSDNAAFCSIEKNQTKLLTAVTDTRDNAQIMTKVMNLIKDDKLTSENAQKIINLPRSIRLKKPDRLLLESNYLKNELDLESRYPEYSVKKIAKLWMILLGNKRNIIIDKRGFEALSCK